MEEQGKYEVTEAQPKAQVTVEPKANSFEVEKLLATAGTIQLTDDQKGILYAPVDEAMVEIRPDGLIYLPWMEYATRLRMAFGLEWAMIPQGMPKISGTYLYWPFYLVVQGKLAGFAIGEQEYQPNNRRMTYGDAVEGAKSNALMRLCKGIGISLELWQPSFIRAWIGKYAESYSEGGRKLWRKKGFVESDPVKQEPKPAPVKPAKTTPAKDPNKEKLHELMKAAGLDAANMKVFYAWADPKTPDDIELFINNFDQVLSDWRAENPPVPTE